MRTRNSAVAWLAGGVASLAGAAIFNRYAARAAEAENPAIGRIIEIDGVQVHYTDSGGSGVPIVLIHGVGSLLNDFVCSGLVSRLAATHRVIAFDRPGYGYTTRPEDRAWTAEAQAALLATAARRLGIDRAVVVGHSWGTLTAIAWALAFPEEVAGLVLLAGYYFPTLRPDALAMNVARVPLVGHVFTDAWGPVQARIIGPLGLKQMFSPGKVTPNFMDGMPFGLMLRPSQVRASSIDGAQMPANVARLSARYHELTLPIVVMWGDGDKVVKQDGQSARLVAQLPTAEGEPMPHVGHMIHHVRPDAVTAAVIALVQRSAGATKSYTSIGAWADEVGRIAG